MDSKRIRFQIREEDAERYPNAYRLLSSRTWAKGSVILGLLEMALDQQTVFPDDRESVRAMDVILKRTIGKKENL